MASMIFNAWRMLASVLPTSEPISEPMSRISVGLPVSAPRALANARLASAGHAKQQDPARPPKRISMALTPHRSESETLQRLQPAEAVEPLAAAMELQEAAFL